jgi:cobalt-zinc-cadmium efflux system outer membrane protein
MEIDAIQSKLEAGILYNDLILSESEWRNSLVTLTTFAGIANNDTLLVPADQFQDSCRVFSLETLISAAVENRSDLLATMKDRDIAGNMLDLVKSGRRADIDLSVGVSNSILNDGVSPPLRGISGGIQIPLKFSNFNKGEIRMYEYGISQAEKIYQQVYLQIISEVTMAWNLYYAFCRQVENFENGMLGQASDVMSGKIYSYKRGESSLLEVLNAQRTYNDIQMAYYEAVHDRATALINLELSAGIWDIDF